MPLTRFTQEAVFKVLKTSFPIKPISTIGNANYGQVGAMITLTPGRWKINAAFGVYAGTGTGSGGILTESGVYGADGTDTSAIPAAISGTIDGYSNFVGTFSAADASPNVGPTLNAQSSTLEFYVKVTVNTPIYLVPRALLNGLNGGQIAGAMTATRVG